MTKRLVDIDDELLAAARLALSTTTLKQTVNRALAEAAAAAGRREFLEDAVAGSLRDAIDPAVRAAAWR